MNKPKIDVSHPYSFYLHVRNCFVGAKIIYTTTIAKE